MKRRSVGLSATKRSMVSTPALAARRREKGQQRFVVEHPETRVGFRDDGLVPTRDVDRQPGVVVTSRQVRPTA